MPTYTPGTEISQVTTAPIAITTLSQTIIESLMTAPAPINTLLPIIELPQMTQDEPKKTLSPNTTLCSTMTPLLITQFSPIPALLIIAL